MRCVVVIPTLLVTLFCVVPAESGPREAAEDDIREVVFRYMFAPPQKEPLTPGYVSSYKIYFIQVDGKDPSDVFLKRFARYDPPVKKYSAGFIDREHLTGPTPVRDRTTGLGGKIFHVGSITWLRKDRVRLRAGYFVGGKNAGSDQFILTRKGNTWSIIKISDSVRASLPPTRLMPTYAKSDGAPPVCQNNTVSVGAKRPARQ